MNFVWLKKMHYFPAALLAFLSILCQVFGGKVLVFPLDGSHWVNMKVLIEELHTRGHNVTVLRASNSWYIKEESPFYTSITVYNSGGIEKEQFDAFTKHILVSRREKLSFWSYLSLAAEVGTFFEEIHRNQLDLMGKIFENKDLMASLQTAKYDLVLTDPAFGGGCFLALRLGLPLVLNVRWTMHGEAHYEIAPSPLSYVPLPGLELTDKMTFAQRVQNIMGYIFSVYHKTRYISSHYQSFCKKYFGSEINYKNVLRDADIWLMRTDFTFEFPRPTMPNIIYMGGFQCKPAKPLPDDLEEFVQSSGDHGLIVMSLGTIFSHLPQDITEEIAAAFARLPQKIIWRHTGPRPVNIGDNTLLVDWLPQNDLLGHPQTKVFITHGGTNSIQEAIYHGVPILGLPIMTDQPDNLSRMKFRGTAKLVDIAEMNRTMFLQALEEVLYNPSYKENIQRLSKLHHDQPMKPLDRAVFWIEFVMRNRGAPHLRTQSFRMSWIEYHSVDVILTLLVIVILICLMIYKIIKCMCLKIVFKKKIKAE
ncbi:UDP-glucuronosyltransferase 2A1-like isoform X1 [Carassius gibelio]|uniref:UDP-glucuronosyltransferase 2A1-like isoform X1 n=1 Tax=Carassius gibelio TaxID=101364 RepID=UPI0022782056|nr:UDP-glucuronosyltransferase 2A1-like isoform X1 [Carassius gibelio]